VTCHDIANAPSIQHYLEHSDRGLSTTRKGEKIVVKLKPNAGGDKVLAALKANALAEIKS
jgi:hypothetical protein